MAVITVTACRKVGLNETVTTTPRRHTCGATSSRPGGAKSDCHGQAVNALRDLCELGGAVDRESWILLRHAFDDVGFRVTLVQQVARPSADCDCVRSALIGDPGVVGRGQKARIRVRIIAARVGLRRRGRPITAAKLASTTSIASSLYRSAPSDRSAHPIPMAPSVCRCGSGWQSRVGRWE
jgi:hypothetical protein